AILTPLSSSAVFIAQKSGVLNELTQIISPPVSMTQIGHSHEPTFLEMTAQQPQPSIMNDVISVGLCAPIIEEMVFRGLIQEVLLKRIPKYVIKKISPGKEIALDSTIAKATRIALTAALFSACHLANIGSMPNVSAQLVATFVAGIGLG